MRKHSLLGGLTPAQHLSPCGREPARVAQRRPREHRRTNEVRFSEGTVSARIGVQASFDRGTGRDFGGLGQMSTSDRQIETNTNTPFGFLGPKDFLRLSSLIYSQCGIRMPEAKKIHA